MSDHSSNHSSHGAEPKAVISMDCGQRLSQIALQALAANRLNVKNRKASETDMLSSPSSNATTPKHTKSNSCDNSNVELLASSKRVSSPALLPNSPLSTATSNVVPPTIVIPSTTTPNISPIASPTDTSTASTISTTTTNSTPRGSGNENNNNSINSNNIQTNNSQEQQSPHVEEEDPRIKERKFVIRELLETEKVYVNDLKVLVNIYVKPLRKLPLLSEAEVDALFSNVELLLNVNTQVLDDLEKICQDPKPLVGDLFLKMGEYFKMYTAYCANHDNALKVLERVMKKPEVAQYFDEQKNNPLCRRLDCEGFIIKPIQRLCKYPLLLRELIKNTPNHNPDYEHLLRAQSKIQDVVNYVNEGRRKAEQYQRMVDLKTHTEAGSDELYELLEGSKYMREGTFVVIGKEKKTHNRLCVLFDTMFLILKKKKEKFLFHKLFRFEFTKLVYVADNTGYKNAFELVHKEKSDSMVICCSTPQERGEWIKEVKHIIKEYQKKDAERKRKQALNLKGQLLTMDDECEEAVAMMDSKVALFKDTAAVTRGSLILNSPGSTSSTSSSTTSTTLTTSTSSTSPASSISNSGSPISSSSPPISTEILFPSVSPRVTNNTSPRVVHTPPKLVNSRPASGQLINVLQATDGQTFTPASVKTHEARKSTVLMSNRPRPKSAFIASSYATIRGTHRPEDLADFIKKVFEAENEHFEDLRLIVRVFLEPMRQLHILASAGGDESANLNAIFSNVEELLHVNEELVQEFRTIFDELEKAVGTVVQLPLLLIFQHILNISPMYKVYGTNHLQAVRLLQKLRSNIAISSFFEEQRKREECRHLDLEHFLQKPVSHFNKLPLLLGEVINIAITHPDSKKLREVHASIDELVVGMMDARKKLENQFKVLDIIASVEGWPDEDIQNTTSERRFVKEGVLHLLVDGKAGVTPHSVHLFNDILLISGRRLQNKYQFVARFSLETVRVIDLVDTEALKNMFSITDKETKACLVLFTPTAEEKKEWVKIIKSTAKSQRKLKSFKSANLEQDPFLIGLLVWHMTTGKKLYENMTCTEVITRLAEGDLPRPGTPSDCPQPIAQLLEDCWHEDTSRRPSILDILARLSDKPRIKTVVAASHNSLNNSGSFNSSSNHTPTITFRPPLKKKGSLRYDRKSLRKSEERKRASAE